MEKEQSERIVNRHYISVVMEINGSLKRVEVDIPQDNILIEEIDAMKENENRTLMDVQQRFTASYPVEKYEGTHYNYLYPRKYGDAYVSGVSYPEIATYEDYREDLAKYEHEIRDKYIKNNAKIKDELEKLKEESEEKCKDRIEEIVTQIMTDYIANRRKHFNYKRFLYAENYTAKLAEIKQDSRVRMYSTDQIGWKEFEYQANDEITVYIKSNFGYGNSSYFFCNLKYKDINILPYTAIIKYYYVRMVDFVRHTRRYATRRDRWNEVFDFAVSAGNMAKHEPERFVKEWIVNEVDEMMVGVRSIMRSPQKELERYLSIQHSIDIGSYSLFRNCTTQDITEYEGLPQEKVMAFKAEKITGCLLLLDNLRRLTEIAPIIIPYIEEIESMNLQLQPEIDKHLDSLTIDISRLRGELRDILKELKPLEPSMAKHKKIIETLQKELNRKSEEGKPKWAWIKVYLKQDAEKEYIKTKPDYLSQKKQYEALTEKKEMLQGKIYKRENLFDILTACKERIAKYFIAA